MTDSAGSSQIWTASDLAVEAERSQQVISAVRLHERWHVLSRYGDDIWVLVGGTTNITEADRRLDFRKIPSCFADSLKAMLFRYMRHGRKGRAAPGPVWVRRTFMNAKPFCRFLTSVGLTSFGDVTREVAIAYVESCRRERSRFGRPLSSGALENRLSTIEALYELSQYCDVRFPEHPWPETTAKLLSVHSATSKSTRSAAKTPIIPDEILAELFKAAWRVVDGAGRILELRDGLTEVARHHARKSQSTISHYQKRYLLKHGWNRTVQDLNSEVNDVRIACYIVIASVSGCRNHELAYVQRGACRPGFLPSGEHVWWLGSMSTKTGAGRTEWMVPEIAVKAVEVMEKWALPYQQRIRDEVARQIATNGPPAAITELERHAGALFLGNQNGKIRTLSAVHCSRLLRDFARRAKIDWKLASHQFRRTFAVYAARSCYGDLRYLREHFKHWSIDMTLLYAANDSMEADLLEEVGDELDAIHQGEVGSWLERGTKLCGGTGRAIVRFRDQVPIELYGDRRRMVAILSENVSIRSTGHGWCTAASGRECLGATKLEPLRCVTCSHSVIGRQHVDFYRRMRTDLLEVLALGDIGAPGIARVQDGIARCDKVLDELADYEGAR